MAVNPRRVTVVDPWVAGGEGQLRDLFPLPPWLILTARAISTSVKHFLITGIILLSIYLWWIKDWSWWQAFLLFPLLFILIRFTLITLWLWYRNPTIPLFARRDYK